MTGSIFESITLDGFQVVNKAFFDPDSSPIMTIWENFIGVNLACCKTLENCEYVKFLLNEQRKMIMVMPTTSNDNDAIRWFETENKFKKYSCRQLTRKLINLWGLNKDYRYRTYGRIVQIDSKVALVFDFHEAISMSAKTKGV